MDSRNTFDPDRFLFRGLHPLVHLGTASDRYAGWVGQIYTAALYEGRSTKRTKTIGRRSLVEEVLPVESVREYFDHFRILEVDYTFYRPLLDTEGKPTPTLSLLDAYRQHLGKGDGLILKVPQPFFARKLLRRGEFTENRSYLDPQAFTEQFLKPAVELLGDHLSGMIFEQEYQKRDERMPPEALAEALDAFFEAIPRDGRYHVELRTEAYLSPPTFDVLRKHGVGQVLSHWTWLPPLHRQFAMAGKEVFNLAGQLIVRLMTPRNIRYEDAYALAYPFNKLVEGMLKEDMIKDVVSLMEEGASRGFEVNAIINNRSGGNAPLIARLIARRFQERAADQASPERKTRMRGRPFKNRPREDATD